MTWTFVTPFHVYPEPKRHLFEHFDNVEWHDCASMCVCVFIIHMELNLLSYCGSAQISMWMRINGILINGLLKLWTQKKKSILCCIRPMRPLTSGNVHIWIHTLQCWSKLPTLFPCIVWISGSGAQLASIFPNEKMPMHLNFVILHFERVWSYRSTKLINMH